MIGCEEYQIATKQIPTFANLKNDALEIQKYVEENGRISRERALEIVKRRSEGQRGLDDWGSPILFEFREDPTFSFILVSRGSDRKLDVDNIEDYFRLEETNIEGQLDHDIVFRDGKCVTVASLK